MVVWEDRSGAFAAIRAQRFDATGKKLGGELAIAVQPGNNEVHPAVAAIAGGGFYVTWTQQVGTSRITSLAACSTATASSSAVRRRSTI